MSKPKDMQGLCSPHFCLAGLRALRQFFLTPFAISGLFIFFASGSTAENAGMATTCQRMNNGAIIDFINAHRAKNGLNMLTQNTRLRTSTGYKVADMVRHSYFAHTNPEGRPFYDNVKKARYEYRSVAEVLAKGCRDERQVFNLWVRSETHNEALLDPSFVDINCSSSYHRGLSYVACHLARPKMFASRLKH